jgi:hypothetical protein
MIAVLILGWSCDGLCQPIPPGCPSNQLGIWKPFLAIQNIKNSPLVPNGTFFVVVLLSGGAPQSLLTGLEQISAQNVDPLIDDDVYEFNVTPTLRSFTGEWDYFVDLKVNMGNTK